MLSPKYDELESEALLRDEVKAFRGEIIKFLLAPSPAGRGMSIKDAMNCLSEHFEATSEAFYSDGLEPENIGANEHHWNSWVKIALEMGASGELSTFPLFEDFTYLPYLRYLS